MPQTLGIVASSISGHLITSNFFIISQQNVSAVSTVTFSSIPATYKSLQVRFNLVTNANSYFDYQFNGDTGTNYAFHKLYGNGSTVVAGGGTTQSYGAINNVTTVTTYPNAGILDIIDYANVNKNKVVKSIFGSNNNTSSGDIELESVLWLSTAAINSLTFNVQAGTFTGTISLYGVS